MSARHRIIFRIEPFIPARERRWYCMELTRAIFREVDEFRSATGITLNLRVSVDEENYSWVRVAGRRLGVYRIYGDWKDGAAGLQFAVRRPLRYPLFEAFRARYYYD